MRFSKYPPDNTIQFRYLQKAESKLFHYQFAYTRQQLLLVEYVLIKVIILQWVNGAFKRTNVRSTSPLFQYNR